MADDWEPPEGLFYDDDDDPDPDEEHVFGEDEIEAIKRLEPVKLPNGHIPEDGAKVLAFRNADKEPVVVPTAVATEAERAYRAYGMRIGGKSWAQIAEEERYPSATAAKADVDLYLAEGRSLVVEKSAKDMLTLEMARLDAMQAYLWPGVTMGAIPAITEARHIIMSRARLAVALGQGLTDSQDGAHTVVIGGTEGNYLGTLQQAAGEGSGVTHEQGDP
jgi:hypothetical protein